MLKVIEHKLHYFILNQSEKFVQKKYWDILLVLLLPVLVLFFCFPSYDILHTEFKPIYDALFKQAANPLTNFHYPPSSHEAKLTFRLYIPFLVRLLHLNVLGVLFIKFLSGLFTYVVLIRLVRSMIKDKVIILWVCLCFISIYAGKTGVTEIRGYIYDGECVLFILAALYFRNPLLIFLCVSLAAWNDERGLIATCLVFAWHLFSSYSISYKITRITAILLAWIGYFLVRIYIEHTYNITTPTAAADLNEFIDNINNMPLGVWTALEGSWLLVIVSFAYLLNKRRFFELLLLSGGYLIIIFVALCVDDITRSMCYLFPAIFLSIRTIQQFGEEGELKDIMYKALLLSAIFPSISACNHSGIMWQFPFPLQALRMIFL